MSIRLVNHLTQNIKCSFLLTKVNQNSNDHNILNPNGPLLRAKYLAASTATIYSTKETPLRKTIILNDYSENRPGRLKNIHGILSSLTPFVSHFVTSNQSYRNVKQEDMETGCEARDSWYPNCQQEKENNEEERKKSGIGSGGMFVAAFSFNFFGSNKKEEDEDPMDKLVTTIKRSILCVQRKQFDKAEQMLHLALRMAQDLQSKDGITYVYDLMANLAMEREQYKKAEKLFADVMKRLLADGHGEDNSKILHISSKLAHMAQLQGELEKAYTGFMWTLERIAKAIKNNPEDRDLEELFGLTKNWFGQLLMKQGKYKEAKKYFEEAYACFVEVYGGEEEEAITILNNLSVACMNLDDFVGAKEYLHKALKIVKDTKDSTEEGVLYANLGIIYLREGLVSKAKEACSLAYRIGKKQGNFDAIEQAEYCLNEIKSSV